ncbi:hypothetical protein MHI39_20120 [Heyndrickxia sp. FSL K6-6286]|uniref:hypothetical protein n=1 Tax=Heyndrickxia sp. FSL K6-6286 TaxID=2921510 RepID=UPI003159A6E5
MVKLNEVAAGAIIKFAGRDWVLLNPSEGYLMAKTSLITRNVYSNNDEIYFAPQRPGSLAYYLNNDYYNSLNSQERSVIKSRTWGISLISSAEGGYGQNTPTLNNSQMRSKELEKTVSAPIGILSISEWWKYSDLYLRSGGMNFKDNSFMWLITPYSVDTGLSGYYWAIGFYSSGEKARAYFSATQTARVTPTLTLDPNVTILNGAVTYNFIPTLTLNSPTDNVTLYETNTLNIEGYAADADNGNIVNARYQLNGGTIRALATGISTGSNTIPFNKQLTFRGGKLYDGDTAVTDELAEGVAHQLKVWSEDDQGGKSPEQLRNFYVVPNRPPALTIDPFATKSDLINADKVTISGTASDPDGNTVVVSYKLNKGMSTEVYRGKDGAWTFDLSLKDLIAGENTVAIEVVDSYNSKTSKTLKLNKNRVATPLLTSEVRYKIDPPSGTAKGVLLWVQRDVGLTVTADISMGLKNEQETYEAMTLTNTAPVSSGVVEDEFVFEASAEKDNIMLKLTLSRESADVNDAITLISGVLS